MNLINFELTEHTQEEMEAFDMEYEVCLRISIDPLRLVVNYNKEDTEEVRAKAIAEVKNYIASLATQAKDL